MKTILGRWVWACTSGFPPKQFFPDKPLTRTMNYNYVVSSTISRRGACPALYAVIGESTILTHVRHTSDFYWKVKEIQRHRYIRHIHVSRASQIQDVTM